MNDKLVEIFLEEAAELLGGLEGHVLALEKNPSDWEALNAAFRALHSIKGAAAMFGFSDAGNFAHKVETVLDLYRGRQLPVSPVLSDLILSAGDHIRILLAGNPDAQVLAEGKNLERRLLQLGIPLEGKTAPTALPEQTIKEPEVLQGPERSYKVRYVPSADAYARGVRPENLIRELKSLGRASAHCISTRVPPMPDFDPEVCYLGWDVIISTHHSKDRLRDVFIFEEGLSEIFIEELDPQEFMDGDEVKRLGEILTSQKLPAEKIHVALKHQRHLGEILIEEHAASPEEVEEALFKQQHARSVVQGTVEEIERKTIRVRSEKLDSLLNLVGELVTVQAQLSQAVSRTEDRHVHVITDYIKRLSSELRATSMEMRMVPLDTLSPKFRRLVRDLAKSVGKDIDLKFEGAETEIDKSVIDALTDPLMHLLRNAADHGLESREERLSRGKSEKGTVTISAIHVGSFIRLVVRDDGGGINHSQVLARAEEKHLVAPGSSLTQEEIEALLFKPGFSTAAKVSNISGRGVGLDVVKTAINQLGGTITIKTERYKGTSFILDIPLTMAITEGFLARVGRRNFIIPLKSVEFCFERTRPTEKDHLLVRDGVLYPYTTVRELFEVDEAPSEREEVVVVRVFDSFLALGFDQILGGFQTVIKPIGELSQVMPGISGAAILADGGIALILDVAALASRVRDS